MKTGCRYLNIFSCFLFASILLFSQISFAQAAINGKIVYNNHATPAAFVSVELAHDKANRAMSDNSGNFYLKITEAQKQDSLVISSVGYKTVRLPVSAALTKSVFILSEIVKTIQGVTVFNSHEVVGTTSEVVGYYRSWSPKRGGEIGRIFNLSHKKFKIDKIRFKAGNTCDTCLLRLHIRSVNKGQPEDEIIEDSITVFVHNLTRWRN